MGTFCFAFQLIFSYFYIRNIFFLGKVKIGKLLIQFQFHFSKLKSNKKKSLNHSQNGDTKYCPTKNQHIIITVYSFLLGQRTIKMEIYIVF